MVHADTMLFILGLTYFVSVIAQTRLLESVSSAILRQQKGKVLPTVAILAGLVAVCSGGLGGGTYGATVSARFAHPLTDTRRPALAHTSAPATPGAGIVTIAPGTIELTRIL